jgi:SSS family solute:Na+ symporter
MVIYVVFVLGIGFALKRHMKNSEDFLISGRSIPAWVTGLAFISANLGALEVMGMAASGAKYGMLTTHFYWIGAILAMIFLAIFMMPFYYGSKARSAPEYLKMRYDEKTRGLNSVSFAVMTILSSGISMHALANLLHVLLGWNYDLSLIICSVVVMAYIFKGGLTSAIYTEVLQFFLIVFGFAPVVFLGLKEVGGWQGLTEKLHLVGTNSQAMGLAEKNLGENAWTSVWSNLGDASANSMGVNWMGMVFGLGFVLAFGYWCTNFLVVQRAMAANSMRAARNTPIIATIPKMVFPLLVIVPGLIAIALEATNKDSGYQILRKEVAITAEAWPSIETAIKSAPDNNAAVKAVLTGTKEKQAFNAVLVGNVTEKLRAGAISSNTALETLKQSGERDYNDVITSMLARYCPTGLLGLALTALLASFMSGMAGNVTAFNTVWTYDIYQSYFAKNKSDSHYMWMGRVATIVCIVLSIGFAYVARQFDNIMDLLQLVFGFVNAPIFAAFLFGMFWKRSTGHGAFLGVFIGTCVSAAFYALTTVGVDGTAWLVRDPANTFHAFQSAMTQNFWLAICSFGSAALVIFFVSLVTKRTKTDEELKGLVYSLTPKQEDVGAPWYAKPEISGAILLIICIALNIYFW